MWCQAGQLKGDHDLMGVPHSREHIQSAILCARQKHEGGRTFLVSDFGMRLCAHTIHAKKTGQADMPKRLCVVQDALVLCLLGHTQ
eukprot:scaffold121657_cov21-Tisochrysis_lutea.AAC.1